MQDDEGDGGNGQSSTMSEEEEKFLCEVRQNEAEVVVLQFDLLLKRLTLGLAQLDGRPGREDSGSASINGDLESYTF